MRTLPCEADFVLAATIDNVPTGATGHLRRLDSYHVALKFDNDSYPELVFDIEDTGPEVRAAIAPIINPSMTDPPLCGNTLRTLASILVSAVLVTFLVQYTEDTGAVLTFVTIATVAFLRDISLRRLFTP